MARRPLFVTAAALVGIGTLAWNTPAPAQQSGLKVGVLTCNVGSGWGFLFGSSRDLKCIFSPNSGPPEHYSGRLRKFGVDIGFVTSAVIVWAVFNPTSDIAAGALAGDYVGATASVSVGVGVGANALVGSLNRSVTLQPLSIEGNQGLNVAAGIGAISLMPAT